MIVSEIILIPMILPLSTPRVDLGQAMAAVLQVLKESPSMSIAALSKATGIDRRTVKKSVDLILKVQESLTSQKIRREKVGKTWMVSIVKKTSDLFDTAKTKMHR